MSVYLVKGEDYTIYIFDGGLWKRYACGRSGNLSVETSTIETTVTGSGDYRTFLPEVHSFTGSIDGIISLAQAGWMTLPELRALELQKTKLLMRFTRININGDVYTDEAYFYITNTTDTGSFDGIATFSIALQGTGAITQIFTPPPPNLGEVYRYPAMGSTAPVAPGTTFIIVPGLGNKNILEVVRDGRGNNDIITSGTPVGQEAKYTTSGADGRFDWPPGIPFDGESWYVLYQNIG